MNSWVDNTSLKTSDGHSSNTTDFVYILKRETKRLIGWSLGRVDIIQGLKEVWSLVPWHIGGFVNHVITDPSRDWNERNLHRLVTNFLQILSNFFLDFLVTFLVVIDSLVVHLIHTNNHLFHTQCEGKESVFT